MILSSFMFRQGFQAPVETAEHLEDEFIGKGNLRRKAWKGAKEGRGGVVDSLSWGRGASASISLIHGHRV